MTSVIVVEDDAAFLRALERDLRREGWNVLPTTDAEEAQRWLAGGAADVLLTDLQMHDITGFDLLRSARDLAPRMRSVLMSGLASARDYETAIELGAVRVLCKPFSTDQLLDAVRQAADCDVGFRGSIHGLGLIDLLQMFHYGQRSVMISIDGGCVGRIYLKSGAIVHAEHRERSGEDALRTLLALPTGSLKTEPYSPVECTITRGFQQVLLDSLRLLDEQEDTEEGSGLLAFRSIAPPRGASSEPPAFPRLPTMEVEALLHIDQGIPAVVAFHTERVAALSANAGAVSLAARFKEAFRGRDERPGALVAVGIRLSTGETECLLGDVDAAAFRAPVEVALDATLRITDSPTGVLERAQTGVSVYIIWDRPGDAAFVLADVVPTTSEAVWLRAAAQTFARRLFGVEP